MAVQAVQVVLALLVTEQRVTAVGTLLLASSTLRAVSEATAELRQVAVRAVGVLVLVCPLTSLTQAQHSRLQAVAVALTVQSVVKVCEGCT